MNPRRQNLDACCDFDRRMFLRAVGGAALAGVAAPALWNDPSVLAAPAPTSAAETTVARLFSSLTTEQKSKIRTSVLQSSSAPKLSRSSINFTLGVGTVVPRSVHFVSVPPTIVEYYPMYRGYSYFIVDDEIIIVDARTMRIVAVILV